MIHDRVSVEWEDIVAHSGWLKLNQFTQKTAVITTVGWITEEFPEYITVSSSMGGEVEDREYNQHITIPRGCIKDISPL